MNDDTHAEMDALQGRVFALAERGASVADIAEEVGRQQRTVKRWLSDPALQQRWGVECVLRRGKLRLVAPVEDEADEGEGGAQGASSGGAEEQGREADGDTEEPPPAPSHPPARDTRTPARAPEPPQLAAADLSEPEQVIRDFITALRKCGMMELAAFSVGLTMDEVAELVRDEGWVRAVRMARSQAPMDVMAHVRDSLAERDGSTARAGLETLRAMWPALLDPPDDALDAPDAATQGAVETLLQALIDGGGIDAHAEADLMAGAEDARKGAAD